MDYITKYLEETIDICKRIDKEAILKVINVLFEAWRKGKGVYVFGNGGSAANASHFAADLFKTTSCEGKKRFKAFCLNENIALNSAIINDWGFENLFYEQLVNLLSEGDVLLAISVHGGKGKDKAGAWSQNLIKAIMFGKEKKAKTIGLAGFDGGLMKEICDVCIIVPKNSTPHTEGIHAVLQHLIIFRLKELIERSNG